MISAAANNQRALWEKAKQAYERHDHKACVTYATALLETHPEKAWQIYYGRGCAYEELRLYDKAIADYNEALHGNLHFVPARIARGRCYRGEGLFQSALSDFNQAIQIDPQNARAYRNRADLEDDMHLNNEAMRDYDAALRLSPRYEPALYNRANHWAFARHEYEKAITDYTECLRLNPKDTDAKHNRAFCYRARGETGRAILEFTDIIRHNQEDICAYVARAQAYLKQGDNSAAIEDAKRTISLVAKNDGDFRCRASAAVMLGQYRSASRDLKEACKRDLSSTAYLDSFAWLLATCPDAAVRNGKQAVAVSQKACAMTGWRVPSFVDTLAAAFAEAGDFEQAVKYEEMTLSKKKWEKAELRLNLFRERKPYRSSEDEIDRDVTEKTASSIR